MIAKKRLAFGTLLAALALGAGAGWLQYPRLRESRWAHWSPERLRNEAAEHPEDGPLQAAASRRLLSAGNLADALAFGRAALRAAPTDARSWTAFGDAAVRAGSEQEGPSALHHAVALDPRAADAYYALGMYYLRRQSSQGAVDQFRQYTRLRPNDARGWLALATAFLEIEEPGNSLDAAGRALALAPENPEIAYLAGEASRRLGKLPEAAADFQRVLKRNPHHAPSLAGLGQVALAQARDGHDVDTAVDYLRRSVAEAPHDARVRYELGHALAQQGKWKDAAAELAQALRDAPDDQRSHFALAQAYDHLGRAADARAQRAAFERLVRYRKEVDAVMRRLREARTPAEGQFELARVHLQYGHSAEAAEALRAGLATDPTNAWANQKLERLQRTPGEARNP